MTPIIQIHQLTKHYGQTLVFENLDLEIKRNQITCLLGENGAGKSTLMKCIVNLVIPDNGSIRIDTDIKNIGCILEGERNIYYYLTVYDNLFYFGKLNRIKKHILEHRIKIVLNQLNLNDKKDSYVSQLSRGMQQKVALAILLIKEPEVLILDEPTLGLDVQSTDELLSYLVTLVASGKTIILTTHQMEIVEQIGDNILILREGKICFSDTKHALLKQYNNQNYVEIETTVPISNYVLPYFIFVDDYHFRVCMDDLPNALHYLEKNTIRTKDIYKVEKSLRDIFKEVMRDTP
ncbi:ABC transporter ATP-binding protein [Staphylococcus massiliensis]|uniref:ABC transporter n=1 Tax=Staphylococcus massiliensis S46 TaxID=1229783 RepID=K9AJJ5_9STAP|nr:ABC transporter ATP-binding protein [Staphylococcus massiliensis]EKU47424.1 ABC transporter [Staphylococcus massiliensis S46]MCG3400341.1 ABC transporter ATP-binding protein [Staphylococcus massiliensis]MCG3401967.1 ABC transporter ATP-binding protein [Staphylococcus massiliensis]MCG3412369.1 ABC transporter ATP-binding protein [Staphylococcus massiliensis]POA00034.1 ABC transporter ATP-binding protein [Staphylococcus massiliensis CCUG 55927]